MLYFLENNTPLSMPWISAKRRILYIPPEQAQTVLEDTRRAKEYRVFDVLEGRHIWYTAREVQDILVDIQPL